MHQSIAKHSVDLGSSVHFAFVIFSLVVSLNSVR